MLLAASRLLNVEKSLNAYLFGQLVTIYTMACVFPRETFGDTLPGQWVEISYIPMAEEFATTLVRVGWGTEPHAVGQRKIFEQRQEQVGQVGGLANQYSLTQAVDTVRDVLGPRAVIPLRDYATSGNPTVAYFGWRSIRAQRVAVDPALGLEQFNISCTLTYAEESI